METVYESQRPRYLLCSLGFGMLGISFILLAVCSALPVLGWLNRDQRVFQLMQEQWWSLAVSLPLSYGALLGSYLLWGRWTDVGWQRRAGLLLFMNLLDAVSATLIEADSLGFKFDFPRDAYFLDLFTWLFGWMELYLTASLAAEVASQLGRPTIVEAGKLSERVALGGLALWIVFFAVRSDWTTWPPVLAQIRTEGELLMLLGVYAIRALSGAQVATLCFLAATHTRRTWKELAEDEAQLTSFPQS